jgi:IS30 family transposase
LKVSTCKVIIVNTFKNLQGKLMHLTIDEREKIMIYIAQKKSRREIARLIWRSHTTINNEINNNSVRGKYSAQKAKHKAYAKRLRWKRNLKKIRCNDELEKYIRKKIKEKRSPELISWRRNKKDNWIKISTPTIYKYIYSRFAYDLLVYLYSNKSWRRRVSHKNSNNHIKYRVFIENRPINIWLLTELGHREADLIVGPK